MSQVVVTSDGSCLYPNGPGGWAALIRFRDKEKIVSGGTQGTTNNRMELMAAIQGLKALNRPCDVKMVVDSQYVMKAFTEGWLKDWKEYGWRNSSGNPVKNQDLWQELEAEVNRHTSVTWEWVRGHNGHPDNERVDEEAGRQSALQKELLAAQGSTLTDV